MNYCYLIKEYLQDVNSYLTKECNLKKKIYISAYSIDSTNRCPYLKYFLVESELNKLNFPEIIVSNYEHKTLIESICDFCLLEKNHNDIHVDGCIEHHDDIYIFVNITNALFMDVPKFRYSCFGCIYELVNKLNIFNYEILDNVKTLFQNNDFLLYLKDENNQKNLTIPLVKYYPMSGTLHKIKFSTQFGISSENKTENGNTYYCVMSYELAIKKITLTSKSTSEIESKNKIKNGIIRIALFDYNHSHVINFSTNLNKNQLNELIDCHLTENVNMLTIYSSEENETYHIYKKHDSLSPISFYLVSF